MDSPCFLRDIFPQHFLYAVTIRSPIASGSLQNIELPRLPGNYTLITAKNIPGENRLEGTSMPILADSKLSYIGEPVALLLGQDKNRLEEYAEHCKVIADEEKPVFSYNNDNQAPASREITIGSPEAAFEKAHRIIRSSHATGSQEHWYSEPTGAVTWFTQPEMVKKDTEENKSHDTILTVRTATQWPFHVKRSLALALGIDPSVLSVEPTFTSLHLDGKLWYPSLVACHAALGTIITNKPVRLILDREEDFLYSPKRCTTTTTISSALDEKGNITGAGIDISVNLGAYGVNADEILDQTCLGGLGFYQIDNLKLTARAYLTNIPPQGPFCGFGLSQGFFAMERHISQIADSIKQDPALWRKEHLRPERVLPSGFAQKDKSAEDELIEFTSAMSDYYRKWASYELLRLSRRGKSLLSEKGENLRGIGMAIGYQGNGLLYNGSDSGAYSIEVTLTKEKEVEIKTSMTCSDNGLLTIWSQLAAEILSIDSEMVHIISTGAPDSGPSCASRNIAVITKLVEKCCLSIRKQRFRDPLPITVCRSVKPQEGALWEGRFTPADGKILDISGFSKPSWAAAVVEVTIDPIESIPKIRGIWMGIDGGKIIFPDKARRNLASGTAQALGWAFKENIEYVNGVLPISQYDNYVIPGTSDIPLFHADFLEDNSGDPRGIGELPFTCVPAAFLQAVSQALDHCFNAIPLKRQALWEAVVQVMQKENEDSLKNDH